ncbi:MAG: phosphoribosylformylglycinamidine synthase subunit PurQ [Thermodesulfobacteriota bacterium]
MRFGIVVFPGSNCDHDCYHAAKHVMGQEAEYVWHKTRELGKFDCLILPGGFSYGDYLRPGSIAEYSPIMEEVKSFADRGGYVVGICNGFQILTETGLLPGALMRNRGLKFICEYVSLRVENDSTPFTGAYKEGQVVRIPIAHADGNYFADDETLERLEKNGQVVFRYSTPDGRVVPEANPNGALGNIAGIINEAGNVMGMMPHPERASEAELGSTDGRGVFESVIASLGVRG